MRSFLLSAVAVSSLAIACSFHLGGETNGTHHNGEFSYSNCFLGCTTTTPMMLDDEEDVSISGSSLPTSLSVETSAPSVVSVKSASRRCCTSGNDGGGSECRVIGLNELCDSTETASLTITVDAPAQGSSDLIIKKSDGTVWDSVTLTVEKAASLSLACNTSPNVNLSTNGTCALTWVAKDVGGRGLMSTAGIHLTSSDANVAQFKGFLVDNQSDIQATPQIFGDVSVEAIGAGDATISGTGGGATETLSVHVM